jgi:hypothetical protein
MLSIKLTDLTIYLCIISFTYYIFRWFSASSTGRQVIAENNNLWHYAITTQNN